MTQPRLKSRTSPLSHPACKNIVCNCYTCNKYSSVNVKRVASYLLVTSASPCTPPNVKRPAKKTGKQFNSIRPEWRFIKKKTRKGRVDEIPDTSKNTPQFRMCKKHRHEHPDSPGKKRKQNLNLPRCFVILQQVFRLAEATVMISFVWFVYFLTFQFVTFVLKQY